MNEVRIIADYVALLPKDLIDVIACAKGVTRQTWHFDPEPKTSFEIAWALAH